ncbi:cytochrome P450 [Streptomyces sp. NPDC087659]|uniref:cytochrome P450 n=1 Tax=Streptomyces sp. NPDC087659 TaxID=3365801 RepID=UPI003809DD5E
MAAGHQRHGPVFRMEIDGADTVLVGTWAGLGELFAAERGRLDVLNTPLVHDLFGQALFNLTGVAHTEARRRLRPPLSSRALAGYVMPLLEVAAPTAAQWAIDPGEDLYAAAREVTLAMSARILLGIRPGEADAQIFADAFDGFVTATTAPSGRRRYMAGRYWSGLIARRRLHALFTRRAVEAGRDRSGAALGGLAAGFEGAPDELGPLADHLLTLLIAARETTASLITWCLVELARHPEHAALSAVEARSAVAEPELLVQREALPIMHSVLAETQRLHSPNLLSVRRAVCPLELGGYQVPAGFRVAYSLSTGHFDPSRYPQPLAFRPGRFVSRQASSSGLWAFGGGAHACLGRPLAELMALTVLVTVLNQGLPRLPTGPPVRVRYRPAKVPSDPVPFAIEALEPAL